MFRSFHIQNFRCFRDLRLDNLERVNLIAGQNNVGKTALLEAILFHIATVSYPRLGELINEGRGLPVVSGHTSVHDTWGPLFYNYDMTQRIELISQDDDQIQRSIRLKSVPPAKSYPLIQNDTSPSPALSIRPAEPSVFAVQYEDSTGLRGASRISIRENRVDQSSQNIALNPVHFVRTTQRPYSETAQRLSELEAVGQQQEIIAALKVLEPRLERLSILLIGGIAVIHADIGGQRLIPIPLLGEGFSRLLFIITAIATTAHGVVLIDEIENGLHYSVMTKVWTAIAQAARAADVQIFATTHSWECITAAHQAFSESETYDFRLHRLDRIGEDIRAVTLDQGMLDTAIQSGLEVR